MCRMMLCVGNGCSKRSVRREGVKEQRRFSCWLLLKDSEVVS